LVYPIGAKNLLRKGTVIIMKYLIVCIGNRDGGDDAVGPYIADQLQLVKREDLAVLDVGIAPENYTGPIKKVNPDNLLIVDAVDMQLTPGDIRIVPPENIGVMHVSTHGIPLPIFVNYLRQYITSITIIGIQPETMNGTITPAVKQSADTLIDIILSEKISKIPLFET